MKGIQGILSGFKTPGIEVTRIEIWGWILLSLVFILVLSLGESNGMGVYQQPAQDLFTPLTIGAVLNSIILYIMGIRLIPFYYTRNKFLRLFLSLLLLLLAAVLVKSIVDSLLIQTFYQELRYHPFNALMEDNLYFTLSAFVLGLPYGIFKSLVHKSKLSPEEVMIIPSGKKLYRFKKVDIYYFEAQGNYVRVVGRFKPELLYTTLSKLENQMDYRYFRRVHRSYIVSVKNALRLDAKQVLYKDMTIPVGKKYQDDIKQVLAELAGSSTLA